MSLVLGNVANNINSRKVKLRERIGLKRIQIKSDCWQNNASKKQKRCIFIRERVYKLLQTKRFTTYWFKPRASRLCTLFNWIRCASEDIKRAVHTVHMHKHTQVFIRTQFSCGTNSKAYIHLWTDCRPCLRLNLGYSSYKTMWANNKVYIKFLRCSP